MYRSPPGRSGTAARVQLYARLRVNLYTSGQAVSKSPGGDLLIVGLKMRPCMGTPTGDAHRGGPPSSIITIFNQDLFNQDQAIFYQDLGINLFCQDLLVLS